jgi:wyosine [tRNA(Phe)-imidazoG37] synthetase (radical SAM superfamily)
MARRETEKPRGVIHLGQMRVKKVYTDSENRKVMEINVLPSKYCTFKCVFCPIGQTGEQTDGVLHFEETAPFLLSLAERIDAEKPDVLFINSMGESFANDQLEEVIALAKGKNVQVSLYTNGYPLGKPEFARIASLCDEVSGEIKAVTEPSFRKLQRPLPGYSLESYLENMTRFRDSYQGRFTVYVTLIKGANDDPDSVEWIRKALLLLNPAAVVFETFTDEKFGRAFGVSDEQLEEIKQTLSRE